jgi:hypothetical protein
MKLKFILLVHDSYYSKQIEVVSRGQVANMGLIGGEPFFLGRLVTSGEKIQNKMVK